MTEKTGGKPAVDLNCDLGESFGPYRMGDDAAVLPYVTSANIACGFHAGDPAVMARTVRLCREFGVRIGAHPGLPDLQGFGRRELRLSPEEAYDIVLYQLGALEAFLRPYGERLHHVKLHGALYNMAAADPALAQSAAEAVRDFCPSLLLYGLAGSQLIRAGQEAGLSTVSEVFADRGYRPDGSLLPRHEPGALIHSTDQAIARVLDMVRSGTVAAGDDSRVPLAAETVCIHGDHPGAAAFARLIRLELEASGILVRSPPGG
ncbi:MAG: LamB/YcsF family protein [Paenibacillaceae bacterium]|jgi:UPF0271 protein|nr:LamB/YcsF family protein [Paenibacillaceae bacterium]